MIKSFLTIVSDKLPLVQRWTDYLLRRVSRYLIVAMLCEDVWNIIVLHQKQCSGIFLAIYMFLYILSRRAAFVITYNIFDQRVWTRLSCPVIYSAAFVIQQPQGWYPYYFDQLHVC